MRLAYAALAVLLATSVATARADEGDQAASYSHRHQIGASFQMGSGYRVLFPYNSEFCGQVDKSVCTGRLPWYMDIGLSYGATKSIEVLGELRVGLERDFSGQAGAQGPRAFEFAGGLRIYVDADGAFKFFSTIEGTVATTDFSATANVKGTDIGIRNVNGVQFDFHRTFGVYAHFGESVSFVDWLRFDLHLGLGVQVRFP